MLGHSGSGKSSLIQRYKHGDQYVHDIKPMPTLNYDFERFTLKQPNGKADKHFHIWDTAGQDRFKTLTQSYFRRANGVIIVYDTTSLESFGQVYSWLKCLQENIDISIPIVLLGNKTDLSDKKIVPSYQGQQLANEYTGGNFFETSAKDGSNV